MSDTLGVVSFAVKSRPKNAVEIEILSRLAAAAACDPCPRRAPRAAQTVTEPPPLMPAIIFAGLRRLHEEFTLGILPRREAP